MHQSTQRRKREPKRGRKRKETQKNERKTKTKQKNKGEKEKKSKIKRKTKTKQKTKYKPGQKLQRDTSIPTRIHTRREIPTHTPSPRSGDDSAALRDSSSLTIRSAVQQTPLAIDISV